MSSRTGKYSCKNCLSQRNILFCTECTELSCNNCVDEIVIDKFYCQYCQNDTAGVICGVGGNNNNFVNHDYLLKHK